MGDNKDQREAIKKLFWAFLLVESFVLPVFRSGGRTGLSFWGWIWNHTIYGPPVEYIPEENYMAELQAAGIVTSSGEIAEDAVQRSMSYFQIDEQAARQLLRP